MAEDSAQTGVEGRPSDVGGASGADHEIDADATSGANDPPGRSGDEERVSGAQIAVKGVPCHKVGDSPQSSQPWGTLTRLPVLQRG